MLSRRLPTGFVPNELAERLARRKAAGDPLLDLTVTNPTRVGLDLPGDGDALHARWDYDPDPAGSRNARAAVTRYYADRGAAVDPDRVVLTASTSEAYAHLFRLLGDPGQRFLVPAPSYPLFAPLAELESVALSAYPLIHDGRWWLDFEALEAACGPDVRGIIVVNPNNPTGSFLSRAESDRIEAFAAARGIPLIVDEVFGDFVLGAPDHRSTFAAGTSGLAFVLSGLSKVCGRPHLKLGWIAVAGEEPLVTPALEGLHWIADAFLSVGSPVQDALPGLLDARQMFHDAVMARVRANLDRLLAVAAGSALTVLPPQGGWSVVVRLPRTRGETEWCTALLDRGVLVHPGHFYDFADEAWAVLSLLPPEDVFRAGAEILAAAAG